MAKWQGKTREWVLPPLTIGIMRDLKRSELSLDLLAEEGQRKAFLAMDVFVDVIAFLCEGQYKAVPLTAEEFLDEFTGDGYQSAHEAFFEGCLADFFRASGRTDLGQALTAQIAVVKAEIEEATAKIATLDLEPMRQRMRKVDLNSELQRRLDQLPTTGS